MGNMQADDYANGVREGWASLRQAVAGNLQSNHYPPLPLAFVGPVMEAIEAANDDDLYADIDMTSAIEQSGVAPRETEVDEFGHTVVKAYLLLEITHSWGFTDNGQEN